MSYVLVALGVVVACLMYPTKAHAGQDSVPISVAIDMSNGRSNSVAVAFPWTREFNLRATQRPFGALQFFPQVSLLGKSESTDPGPRKGPLFTMGGGVCLASAFALAVGVKVNEPFAHAYVMAGLSLTDIVKLAL